MYNSQLKQWKFTLIGDFDMEYNVEIMYKEPALCWGIPDMHQPAYIMRMLPDALLPK